MGKTIDIPDRFDIEGDFKLEAAAGDGPRRFRIEAYTGGAMNFGHLPAPVVVNIAGVDVGDQNIPVLSDHEEKLSASVGHTERVTLGTGITVEGPFSGSNAATEEVVSKLDHGMKLQASVGVRYGQSDVRSVSKGQRTSVNGRTFEGPLLVIERSRLSEVSVVPIGADRKTSVRLAATAFNPEAQVPQELKLWAADRGIALDDLDAAQLEKLTASYQADTAETPEPKVDLKASDDLAASRKRRAEEADRCDQIEKLCASHGNPEIKVEDETLSLKAHAIADGWSVAETKLAAYEQSAPKAPATHVRSAPELTDQVLQCSLAMQMGGGGSAFCEKHFDAKTLEAANSRRNRGMGIQRAMCEQVLRAGGNVPPGSNGDAIISAYQEHVLNASGGFTTNSLPNLLGELANKVSQSAFTLANTTYEGLTAEESNRNFQVFNRVRFGSGLKFEPVGKDGELKHGKLHEETYETQVETEGMMLALTRQDIINDDLGAFNELPRLMGRQGAITKDKAFAALVEATDASFYSASKKSLKTSNAFSYDGITAALNMFAEKTDKAGDLIAIDPQILMVPQALEEPALRLMRSLGFNETTTANTPAGDTNIYANRFRVVVNKRLTSPTTWYLLADPADEAAFVNVTLNGQSAPVVEQVASPANVLGMTWRSYMDYQIAKRTHEAIVKCTA